VIPVAEAGDIAEGGDEGRRHGDVHAGHRHQQLHAGVRRLLRVMWNIGSSVRGEGFERGE
jgi:hypothetical protein